MKPSLPICILAALLSACTAREPPLTEEAPPPAAALVAERDTGSLSHQLGELAAVLDTVEAGRSALMFDAEAMTDEMLQARRSKNWLASGYDIEARVRQLQAMADRIVARLRRGASLRQVSPDVQTLKKAALELRTQLAQPGGGSAPPPLDSLLSQDPLRDVTSSAVPASAGGRAGRDSAGSRSPADSAGGGGAQRRSEPLGRPVGPGGT